MKFQKHALFFLLLAASCTSGPQGTPVSVMPDLPIEREYVLAARQVDDTRLPRLADAQFALVLDRIAARVKEYLGYRITFTMKPALDLLAFRSEMAYIEDLPAMKEVRGYLLDPEKAADRERLRSDIAKTIGAAPDRVLAMQVKDFGKFPDRASLAGHVYRGYVDNLRKIYQIPTHDVTLLADPAYLETLTYPFWDMAVREYGGAQFILSNTVMADMETELPIYVILRGGVTTGLTERNEKSHVGGAIVLFTLPFISDDNFFTAAREEAIPAHEMTDVIALYAVHEFGHLLNHYKDYSDHENCIMVPAHGLNYYKWYRERKEKKCELPHEKLAGF
ncbi:MAG: hypothetical protein EPN93_16360 [Spirochaetes bacterium]|nr:MAG: hypothetical protein EPN93_16360 [Spirochaetota bacterium]